MLRDKLFQIATAPRKFHGHPRVVLPENSSPLPPHRLFRSSVSFRVLELGAGRGEFCIEWLQKFPDHDYVAFEIKKYRIEKILKKITEKKLENLHIIPVNFNWFLETILPPHSFDLIIVNFPDPWPKKRHRKHRLVNSDFPERAASLLRPAGKIHFATDHSPYARQILRIFRKHPLFRSVFPFPNFVLERPSGFPASHFEIQFLLLQKKIFYQQWIYSQKEGMP